jgi:BlaI family penicillinase repressor
LAQRKQIKLSPFELKAMEALWKLGRASIREILEQLPGKRRPAYTTVQTVVYRLEAKGAVRKLRKIGNAHIFVPVISRREAYRRLVSDFLDLFSGSARPVMSQLAETGQLTAEDLRDLEKILEKKTSRRKNSATEDPKPE